MVGPALPAGRCIRTSARSSRCRDRSTSPRSSARSRRSSRGTSCCARATRSTDHRPRARVHPAEPVRIEQIGGGRRMRDEEVRRHVDAAWSEPFDYERRAAAARAADPHRQEHRRARLPPARGRLRRAVLRPARARARAAVRGRGRRASRRRSPSRRRSTATSCARSGPSLDERDAEAGRAHWREALAGAPLALPLPHEQLERRRSGGERPVRAQNASSCPRQLVARLQRARAGGGGDLVHAPPGRALRAAAPLERRDRPARQVAGREPRSGSSGSRSSASSRWCCRCASTSATTRASARCCGARATASLAAFRHASHAPEDNALRRAVRRAGPRRLVGRCSACGIRRRSSRSSSRACSAKPYREDGEAGELVLVVTERSDGRTVAQLSSSSSDLDARALGELLRHYERLLEQVAEDPDRRVGSEVELLTPAERDALSGRAPGARRRRRRARRPARARRGGGARGRRMRSRSTRAAGRRRSPTRELDARAAAVAGAAAGARRRGRRPRRAGAAAVRRAARRAAGRAEGRRAWRCRCSSRGSEDDPLAGLPPLATVARPRCGAAAPADGGRRGDGREATVEARTRSSERVALVVRTTGVTDGPARGRADARRAVPRGAAPARRAATDGDRPRRARAGPRRVVVGARAVGGAGGRRDRRRTRARAAAAQRDAADRLAGGERDHASPRWTRGSRAPRSRGPPRCRRRCGCCACRAPAR